MGYNLDLMTNHSMTSMNNGTDSFSSSSIEENMCSLQRMLLVNATDISKLTVLIHFFWTMHKNADSPFIPSGYLI